MNVTPILDNPPLAGCLLKSKNCFNLYKFIFENHIDFPVLENNTAIGGRNNITKIKMGLLNLLFAVPLLNLRASNRDRKRGDRRCQ
jgi:hypothetical protein